MSTAIQPRSQSLLLDNVSWQGYESFLKEFDGRPIRLTYDEGSLEIMTLSFGHESYSWLIGRLIATLTEELNIPLRAGKSTTLRLKRRKKGLEADECFWIQNESQMRGKKEFDLNVDPPPDLALEIDITHSSLDRMAIYAGLKILEVWRLEGNTLRMYRLLQSGKYELCERSVAFPSVSPADIMRFLHESDTKDETSLIRSFRAWIREHVLPVWIPPEQTKQTSGKNRKSKKKDENGQGA